MTKRNTIYQYMHDKYGTCPDTPFRKFPGYEAFRHSDNRKIFGLIMDVKRGKLGIEGPPEEYVDILNVKCTDDLRMFLLNVTGVLPCYHMHAGTWISLLLDGSLSENQIFDLIDLSYELTSSKGKVKNRKPHNPNWIVPANPKYYDIEKAIADGKGVFLWKQSNSILAGDIVYLYVAAPVSAIRYECKVLEADVPYPYEDENVSMKKVMRLKLLNTFDKEIFSIQKLKAHGVTTVRGPRSIPSSLLQEINHYKQ